MTRANVQSTDIIMCKNTSKQADIEARINSKAKITEKAKIRKQNNIELQRYQDINSMK